MLLIFMSKRQEQIVFVENFGRILFEVRGVVIEDVKKKKLNEYM